MRISLCGVLIEYNGLKGFTNQAKLRCVIDIDRWQLCQIITLFITLCIVYAVCAVNAYLDLEWKYTDQYFALFLRRLFVDHISYVLWYWTMPPYNLRNRNIELLLDFHAFSDHSTG